MGDGVKEDTAVQTKEQVVPVKAGWLKKSSGKFLAGYKDRYIHLEKTEVVFYENEDLQTCIERLDLENYDTCLELRGAFKRKNRLVLIRTQKTNNKIPDVKFQAQNPEEKESWIKALRDGINRAKNKIFDEVKVTEGSNLDHVTRSRPKGNRGRRPPTRIHMKEVANVSSDGILRLDLDLEDAMMPNGTRYDITDMTADTAGEKAKPPTAPSKVGVIKEEEEATDEEEPQAEVQKKVLKPPMPPTKESKPPEPVEKDVAGGDAPETKVLKPPMPPSKDVKPTAAAQDDLAKEDSTEKILKIPIPPSKDAKPKTPPEEEPAVDSSSDNEQEILDESVAEAESPATPPNTVTGSSIENLAEISHLKQGSTSPPTPPSKDKKPALAQNHEPAPAGMADATGETKEEREAECEEGNQKEEAADVEQNGLPETVNEMESPPSLSEELLPEVKEHATEPSASTAEDEGDTKLPGVLPAEQESSGGADTSSIKEPQESSQLTITLVSTPEPNKKSPCPPPPPKKKPLKALPLKATLSPDEPKGEETVITDLTEKRKDTASPQPDILQRSSNAEEDPQILAESKTTFSAEASLLTDPVADHPCEEKKEREEEKSVDSGRHSDDDSAGSENEGMLEASTPAVRGSNTRLDLMDLSDDEAETPKSLRQNMEGKPTKSPRPPIPAKPSIKPRSVSMGDLLSESPGEMKQPAVEAAVAAVDAVDAAPKEDDDVMDLEREVAEELEETGELLSSVAQWEGPSAGNAQSEELLVKALEKLKRADQFLRKATTLKGNKRLKDPNKRGSW